MEQDDTARRPPEQPHSTAGKLDLILWRLTELERDLSGTVTRNEYETRQEQLSGRVSALEAARAESAKERRTVFIGITVALSIPALRFILEVIKSLEGIS